MKIDRDHSLMVRTLAKDPRQILDEITPRRMNLLHAAVGISGEAGELLDAVKKACIYNKTLDTVNIIEELGDLEFYMEQLRQELGVTRVECLSANMAKLAVRYEGMKFSNEAAQIRRDKMTASELASLRESGYGILGGELLGNRATNAIVDDYGMDEGTS